jgi:BirA family biotin operon repressor/biotin-[acetyl-CoA-carboxylase] ligase
MAKPAGWPPAADRLAGTAFTDVRWVDDTGSTNADLLAQAREGAAHGLVLVADHQTAGRGRRDRTWTAPPGASLLVSVLLRLAPEAAALASMAVAVAAADAVGAVAGVTPRLKWPNDLVWPGDGSAPDRKLAGILAEADWPAGTTESAGYRPPDPWTRVAVVVGMGLNVAWPAEPPSELADVAVALNHITERAVSREDLLVAWLRALDARLTADPATWLNEWRVRSATLGRRVRVDLGAGSIEGVAVDVDDGGRLLVDAGDREPRAIAVGDVVHVRTS